MNYAEKIARINQIYNKYEFASGTQVLFHKRNKLLLGASFDNIYYYQFFVLFTNVKVLGQCTKLEEFITVGSGLRPNGKEGELFKTQLSLWDNNGIQLLHKDVFFFAPKEVVMTSSVYAPPGKKVRTLDYTWIVDNCLALVDEYPPS